MAILRHFLPFLAAAQLCSSSLPDPFPSASSCSVTTVLYVTRLTLVGPPGFAEGSASSSISASSACVSTASVVDVTTAASPTTTTSGITTTTPGITITTTKPGITTTTTTPKITSMTTTKTTTSTKACTTSYALPFPLNPTFTNWTETGTGFNIANCKLTHDAASQWADYAIYQGPGGPNCKYSLTDMQIDAYLSAPSGSYAGILFRSDADGTGYGAVITSPGNVYLVVFTPGNDISSVLAAGSGTVVAGTLYHVRVVVTGTLIEIYLTNMGAPVISQDDGTFTAGVVGVRGYNTATVSGYQVAQATTTI